MTTTAGTAETMSADIVRIRVCLRRDNVPNCHLFPIGGVATNNNARMRCERNAPASSIIYKLGARANVNLRLSLDPSGSLGDRARPLAFFVEKGQLFTPREIEPKWPPGIAGCYGPL